jgi:hypothetical protein
MYYKKTTQSKWSLVLVSLLISLCITGNSHAAKSYSPNDVFAGVDYANRVISKILVSKNIGDIRIPSSKEKAAKPMHVYELQVAVLAELYHYALKNNRRPPPLPTSTPIKYSPTDVYYLTQLIMNNVDEIYSDNGGSSKFNLKQFSGKSPAAVYQALFELYYKVNRLNGKSKVSPSEVYSHIYRAKEDLQYSLLTLSKSLPVEEEDKKRLLTTAIYGMHPDGSTLPALEQGKKPGDVMSKAFDVRKKLNTLRKKNSMAEVSIPAVDSYGKVNPIDVFLQTQFIIAELNLLKIPMAISSTTNSAKPVANKTPSDVYHEMKHIDYMLDRLIRAL